MNRRKSKKRKSKVGRSNWKVKQPIIKKNKPKKMDSLLIWELVRVAAPVLGIAVIIFATIRIHNIKAENVRIEKAISATSGVIQPPTLGNRMGGKVTVLFGGNELNLITGNITKGKFFNPMPMVGAFMPLEVSFSETGALLVNARFTDFDGSIVAVMKNNEWEMNPNNYFRRNYDEQAFEITDKDGITKFQIEFINNVTIKFGGVFRDSVNWWFVTESKATIYDIGAITKEEIIEKSVLVPEIFEYPATKYIGVRKIK